MQLASLVAHAVSTTHNQTYYYHDAHGATWVRPRPGVPFSSSPQPAHNFNDSSTLSSRTSESSESSSSLEDSPDDPIIGSVIVTQQRARSKR